MLILSACAGFKAQPTSGADLQTKKEENELDIYSILLENDMASYIVVLDKTVYKDYEDLPDSVLFRAVPALSAETLNDFKQVNQASHEMPSTLELNSNYVLVSQVELNSLISEYGDWEKFNQKYQNENVYYFLSRIGFNSELNQALVYMGYSCGGECGKGDIYFLVHDGDKWVVAGSCEVWVS
jgi:hypothetical protein